MRFDYEIHASPKVEHAQDRADASSLHRQVFNLMRIDSVDRVSLNGNCISSDRLETVLPTLSFRHEATQAAASLIEQVLSIRSKRSHGWETLLNEDLPIANSFLPHETLKQIQNINSLSNIEGTITGELIQKQYIPPRDVQPQTDVPDDSKESSSIYTIKNVIASLFHPDKKDVYGTVRAYGSDDGFRIGRYGLTANLIHIWFLNIFGSMDFDDPDVLAKLIELSARGVIPRNFARKMLQDRQFRQGFRHFLLRLDKNLEARADISNITSPCLLSERDQKYRTITAEELRKYVPKELQERIATDLTRSFAERALGDPGKIALAFFLGKLPDKLAEEDQRQEERKSNGARHAYMHAAKRLFGLLQAAQIAHPGTAIHFDGNSTRLGQKIARAAAQTARKMNTRGWCARGVETTLAKFGVHYGGNAKDTDAFFDRDPRFKRLKSGEVAQIGDVCVMEASPGHPWGHTFVFLGNGLEASDHIAPVTHRPNAIAKVYRMKEQEKTSS